MKLLLPLLLLPLLFTSCATVENRRELYSEIQSEGPYTEWWNTGDKPKPEVFAEAEAAKEPPAPVGPPAPAAPPAPAPQQQVQTLPDAVPPSPFDIPADSGADLF